MIRIYMNINGDKREIHGHHCYTKLQAQRYCLMAPANLTFEVG